MRAYVFNYVQYIFLSCVDIKVCTSAIKEEKDEQIVNCSRVGETGCLCVLDYLLRAV